MPWRSELKRLLGGDCFFDVPLASLTSWSLGGPAECLAVPRTPAHLASLLKLARREAIPLWVLGGGTNVLVPDEGLKGITLHTGNLTAMNRQVGPDGRVELICGAGVPLKRVLQTSFRQGLSGLEFAAGIPGSVGGAVVGNAGASGRGVGDLVITVKTMDRSGKVRIWERADLDFTYRKSSLQSSDLLVLSCTLSFRPADKRSIAARIREHMSLRSRQPHGARTAGCVFKNPDGMAAGKLLEDCGCKGLEKGSVAVSTAHANFFVNRGGGTASQMWELIQLCREKVFRHSGVLLDLEVTLLGESWR